MKEDMPGLTRIGSLVVPDNPGGFDAEKFIRPGSPGINGVGAKLAEEIKEHALDSVCGGKVLFYRSSYAETNEIPEALRTTSQPINWWQLYWALQWPGVELFKALRYKDQIGCFVVIGRGSRPVRVKLDWREGHSIGGRPTDQPNWAWNEGTIFAVQEPRF